MKLFRISDYVKVISPGRHLPHLLNKAHFSRSACINRWSILHPGQTLAFSACTRLGGGSPSQATTTSWSANFSSAMIRPMSNCSLSKCETINSCCGLVSEHTMEEEASSDAAGMSHSVSLCLALHSDVTYLHGHDAYCCIPDVTLTILCSFSLSYCNLTREQSPFELGLSTTYKTVQINALSSYWFSILTVISKFAPLFDHLCNLYDLQTIRRKSWACKTVWDSALVL